MDYQTAFAAVTALPVEEQARLVAEVRNRLDDEDDRQSFKDHNANQSQLWLEVLVTLCREFAKGPTELNDSLRAELVRRSEEFDRNPNSGIPWEVVEARLRAKYQL